MKRHHLSVPVLLLLLPVLACGKRGDPRPPLRRTPPPVAGLRVAQRGAGIEASGAAPATSVDGVRFSEITLEFFVAQGDGDFEKLAARRPNKAIPGERVSEIVPLPAAGTTVRVAVRALAGGHPSVRSAISGLVAQTPPAAPRGLTAELVGAGVALGWTGPRPAPVKAALPVPAPLAGPATPPTTLAADAPPPFPGGFSVYRRAKDGIYALPLGPPINPKSFTDTSAPVGATWCYEVRATASLEPLVESDPSEEACVAVADISAPAPPTGLSVLPVAEGLELTWSPSGEGDLAGYRVLRSSGAGAPEALAEVAPIQTQFVDRTAARGVRYRYRLVAFDRSGNQSPPGEPAENARP